MTKIARIEKDEEITKLLEQSNKYYREYLLNLINQDYFDLAVELTILYIIAKNLWDGDGGKEE